MFDIVELTRQHLVTSALARPAGALDSQRRESALNRGLVPTLAPSAHAAGDALIDQQSLEVF